MNSVQDMINQILWDRRIVIIPADITCDHKELIIYNPTLSDRNLSYAAKESLLQQLKSHEEMPSAESIIKDAKENGYWSEEDDVVFNDGDKYVAMMEKERSKKKLVIQKQQIDEKIKDAKQKMEAVAKKRQELLSLTAEYMADESYALNMVHRTVRTGDGQLMFRTEADVFAAKSQNPELLSFLLKEVMSEGFLSHAEIRKVARSVDWRMLWTLNREDIAGIFGVKLGDLSLNQKMLIYWSRVYDIAYESAEKPDDDVINDDDRFDEWLQNRNNVKDEKIGGAFDDSHEVGVVLDGYYIETCTCGVADIKVKGHGERPPHDPSCNWGKYIRYTKAEKEERARQVYGRNASDIRRLINQECNAVDRAGFVDEKDLRNQKARLILGSKQKVQEIRR